MEEIIRDLLLYAEKHHNPREREDILEFVGRILEVLSETQDAPQDWREIGRKLAEEWNYGTFDYSPCDVFFEKLELGNFGADECFGVAASDDE